MARYEPSLIEPKWQDYWDQHQTFATPTALNGPKYYVLDMFPYPSGAGLHVGHPSGYTATDIMARYKRAKGFNVLHPMGWDAFGLPAEQYAIQTGTHPEVTTQKNIANFKRQLKSLGFSYDWTRELSTTHPDYYRWTQWIFLQLYQRGLAYVAEVPVNWCLPWERFWPTKKLLTADPNGVITRWFESPCVSGCYASLIMRTVC